MLKILRYYGAIPILFCLLTNVYVDMFSSKPVGSTLFRFTVCLCMLISLVVYKIRYFAPENKSDYRIVGIYFIWMIIGCIRGFFVADNYWEYMQLYEGLLCLSMPITVYVFSNPGILQKTLHLWLWVALLVFGVHYFWVLDPGAYHFSFGPLFIACFIPVMPTKWKIGFLGLCLLMLFADFAARSQLIKAGVVLFICLAYIFYKYIPRSLFYLAHWLCYIGPVVLLYLAIAGIFNPLAASNDKAMQTVQDDKVVNGVSFQEDMATDSRTFIYEEVINSAVKHDYIWFGRTPARGNDSWWFGKYHAEELKTGKYERHGNEMCHPNIFTWLGLLGVSLYGLIFLKSSYLALYKSNSLWMKLIGVFIAFRWAFGWIEDTLEFNVMHFGIWMTIAMGLSEKFRAMSDKEIEEFVLSILKLKSDK